MNQQDILIRGNDVKGIDKRALELCQHFIGGSWNNAQSVQDILCTRIIGGNTNQLYKVTLKSHVERSINRIYINEPDCIAIKIYQKKHFLNSLNEDNERLYDTIILTTLSEKKICPTVYGIFDDGFIQQFFPSELFGSKAQADSELLKKMLFKLAQTHSLILPIRKNVDTLFVQMRNFLKIIYEKTQFKEKIKELDAKEFLEFDFYREVEYIEQIWKQFNFPPKFCHMDLLGSNILVSTENREISLIDFEYSTFSCRGFDISTVLCQWGIEPMQYEKISLPQDSIIEKVIIIYREQCELIEPGYCDFPENSMKQILYEVKICFCVYALFFTAFYIFQTQQSKLNNNDSSENFSQVIIFSIIMYRRYILVRKRLIQDGIVDEKMNYLLKD